MARRQRAHLLTTLTSGGVTIPSTDYFLEPNRSGPPFNRLEIDLDSSAAYGGGDTHQRNIAVTGLWGYRNTETAVGALAEALDASETAVDVNGAAAAALGVGSILRVDSERMLVTGRRMLDTGQNVGGSGLTAQANSVTVTVADGTAFAVDEILLIESERMLIVDIAGNNLTVIRAWDGSVLAAHAAAVDIYAARTLTVRRGALGTTAATHSTATSVVRWEPPGLVRDLVIAEVINRVTNEQAGYARTRRTSGGLSSNDQAKTARDLPMLREQTYSACGRKARLRGCSRCPDSMCASTATPAARGPPAGPGVPCTTTRTTSSTKSRARASGWSTPGCGRCCGIRRATTSRRSAWTGRATATRSTTVGASSTGRGWRNRLPQQPGHPLPRLCDVPADEAAPGPQGAADRPRATRAIPVEGLI